MKKGNINAGCVGFFFICILLIVFLNGCDLECARIKCYIQIPYNTNKVLFELTYYNIGSKENDIEEAFEALDLLLINNNTYEITLKQYCSETKLTFKKFWVDNRSLIAVFRFEFPDLRCLSKAIEAMDTFDLDESGNLFSTIDSEAYKILETNGKVNQISDKIQVISWPPGYQSSGLLSFSKEMHFIVQDKYNSQINSFSELFFFKHGPSKTIKND